MGVSIEWISSPSGLVRMGPAHFQFGDPYTTGLILTREETFWLAKMATGPIEIASVKELKRLLASLGADRVCWDRARGHRAEIKI